MLQKNKNSYFYLNLFYVLVNYVNLQSYIDGDGISSLLFQILQNFYQQQVVNAKKKYMLWFYRFNINKSMFSSVLFLINLLPVRLSNFFRSYWSFPDYPSSWVFYIRDLMSLVNDLSVQRVYVSDIYDREICLVGPLSSNLW